MFRTRKLVTTATVAVTVLSMVIGLAPQSAGASSHREAPLIKDDPVADNTDLYAFVSEDDPTTVTIVNNVIPMEEPAGGPNYYAFSPDVRYNVVIDNNGDAQPDMTFTWIFQNQVLNPDTFLYNTCTITRIVGDTCWNERQTYQLTLNTPGNTQVLGRRLPVPPVNIGPASTPDYEALARQAIRRVDLPGPGNMTAKIFAGQRDDPFFVDFSLFDLLTIRPINPANGDFGQLGGGIDGLAGFSVHSMVIQLPIEFVTRCHCIPSGRDDPDAVIGIWAYNQRRQYRALNENGRPPRTGGEWQTVSELAMPLVNEVVIPLRYKDLWNNKTPDDGQGIFVPYVQNSELAGLITAIYGVPTPPNPRQDLVDVFLNGLVLADGNLNHPMNCPNNQCVASEQLRLNLGIPACPPIACEANSRYGVIGGDLAGFPNGRRLYDDVTDIETRVVAGVLVPGYDGSPNSELGDGVDTNDQDFTEAFPYVASPISGFSSPHGKCYATPTNPTCRLMTTPRVHY